MILADHQLEALCQPTREQPVSRGFARQVQQTPLVDPYIPENIQPASIDVRLGTTFKVFQRDSTQVVDLADPVDITKTVEVPVNGSFLLHPGEFVLGHTIERLCVPHDLVARVEGKSSLGRLGLIVHATAGYIDPGFQGRVTLEMTCFHPLPIMLRPELLIAQISFHQMSSPAARPYAGRYQGDDTVAASRYGQPLGHSTSF